MALNLHDEEHHFSEIVNPRNASWHPNHSTPTEFGNSNTSALSFQKFRSGIMKHKISAFSLWIWLN